MKKLFKILAVALAAILLAGMLPLAGLAADDEWVLTAITHDGLSVKPGQSLF
jgi:hypothetical protein